MTASLNLAQSDERSVKSATISPDAGHLAVPCSDATMSTRAHGRGQAVVLPEQWPTQARSEITDDRDFMARAFAVRAGGLAATLRSIGLPCLPLLQIRAETRLSSASDRSGVL